MHKIVPLKLWTSFVVHFNTNPCLTFIIYSQQSFMITTELWLLYSIILRMNQNEQLLSGHTLPWHTWRTANRVRSGQAATPAAKHLWGYRESKTCMCGAATYDLGHIMTNCRHFGERPNRDDMAKMKGRGVRWMSDVADMMKDELIGQRLCRWIMSLTSRAF